MVPVHVSCQSEGVNSRSLRLGWRYHRGQSCPSPQLFWKQTQNQPTQGGLATQGRASGGTEIHLRRGVGNVRGSTTFFDEIPTWTACFSPFDPNSRMLRIAQPLRLLLCCRLHLPFPPADVAANLTLLVITWRGVPCGRGLGKAEAPFGMRCSSVSRSRGTGHDKHVCSPVSLVT